MGRGSCASHDYNGNCVSGSHIESRNEPVSVRVEDGHCDLAASYAFASGATYGGRITQSELQTCSITCEQVGVVRARSCRPALRCAPPVTEHYENSLLHYAGYPTTARGIGTAAIGLGSIFANKADSSITNVHCGNGQCDAVGDAEIKRSQYAQLPGTMMLIGGLGATAGGLLLINVSGHWVRSSVSVGAASNRVVLGGTF